MSRTLILPDEFSSSRVTLPLDDLLETYDRIHRGEGVMRGKLDLAMEILGQIEVFLDYLKDTQEEMFSPAVSEFNSQSATSKIIVQDGHVRIKILSPKGSPSEEEEPA